MVDRMKGKVALITGASRGQGRAMAELFVEEGAVVISGDVLDARDTEGSSVDFQKMDITKPEDWKRIVDGNVAEHGKIDVLVNNAAICEYEPILETTIE